MSCRCVTEGPVATGLVAAGVERALRALSQYLHISISISILYMYIYNSCVCFLGA